MINRKSLLTLILILLVASATVAVITPQDAYGQFTIPTRTPVPDDTDPEPTDEPNPTDEPDDPDPDDPDPADPTAAPTAVPTQAPATSAPTQGAATSAPTLGAPTNTPVSAASATAIPVRPTNTPFSVAPGLATNTPLPPTEAPVDAILQEALIAFPAGGAAYPQADPCGTPPTFTSSEAISVLEGPGNDYEIVGLLGIGEVRPIIGRAAFAEWWVLQLDASGRVGWVADRQGVVHGQTNRVAIISAPDLNGVAPTPGGNPWVPPTPAADCAAQDPAQSAAVVSEANDAVPPSGAPVAYPVVGEQSLASEEARISTVGEGELNPNGLAEVRSGQADRLLNDLAENAQPLEAEDSGGLQLPNFMPIVGVGLVLLAVVIGLLARRGGSTGQES